LILVRLVKAAIDGVDMHPGVARDGVALFRIPLDDLPATLGD
jgi:hypothetical protein